MSVFTPTLCMHWKLNPNLVDQLTCLMLHCTHSARRPQVTSNEGACFPLEGPQQCTLRHPKYKQTQNLISWQDHLQQAAGCDRPSLCEPLHRTQGIPAGWKYTATNLCITYVYSATISCMIYVDTKLMDLYIMSVHAGREQRTEMPRETFINLECMRCMTCIIWAMYPLLWNCLITV